MKTPIADLISGILKIKGCQFASFTYRTKKTKELARYTVILGFDYLNAVRDDITDLEILIGEIQDKTSLEYQAATLHLASLNETLTSHETGGQHSAYTKAGQYIPLGKGLALNTTDNTLQLFGLVVTKVQLEPGEPQKPVKSAALTIAKNKIRRRGKVGKLREFALDEDTVQSVRISGDTIEFGPPEYSYQVNPPVNLGADMAAVLVMGETPVMAR